MRRRLSSGCSPPGDPPRAWTGQSSMKNMPMLVGLGPCGHLVNCTHPYSHLQCYAHPSVLSPLRTCFCQVLAHGQPTSDTRQLSLQCSSTVMLSMCRVRLREAYLRVQHSANVEMAAGTDPYMRMRTPDDSIRYQSTIYALVRVLDKTVLLARTVQTLSSGPTCEHARALAGQDRAARAGAPPVLKQTYCACLHACVDLLLQGCVLGMYGRLLLPEL